MSTASAAPNTCSVCGATRPAASLGEHCARCLLRVSVETLAPELLSEDGEPARLGDYELLDEIARGGVGVVYRARQRALGRIVAVKVLIAGEFASEETRLRFRAEAEAAARLHHPGIVAIHDVGESNGIAWFSMEYVPGGTLADLVRDHPMESQQAAQHVRAIAEAVQHAHEEGILHRDLKPSNVLLDPARRPRITDFGIARRFDAQQTLTRTGALLGSPGYMSPEQAFGEDASIGPATDVYGLGALLYHLLTGRPPFQAPTLDAILLQLRDGDPLAPRRLNPAVPRDLETICLHCMRKDTSRRYATAREVADELGRFAAAEPIHARAVSTFERTWRWCLRRPALAASLAALALVGVVAFALVDAARRAEAGAKTRAQVASAQLRESLDTTELDHAEDLFRTGDSAEALGLLARVVRRDPAHPVAAARLGSALWHGQFALPMPPSLTLSNQVSHLQLLRDEKRLLVCTYEGAELWNAALGRRLVAFEHGGDRLNRAMLSPDETTLVLWDQNAGREMCIFDVATGHLRVPPISHEGLLHSVRFSPDNTRVVTAGAERFARVFDALNGQPVGEPLDHPMGLWSAEFSADGETIATAAGSVVRLWNTRTHQLRRELPACSAVVTLLRSSPDGRLLLATCLDGAMHLFSSETGDLTGFPMRHDDRVRTAAFSSDGRFLLTASNDHTARVWSIPAGEPLSPPLRHRDAVNFAAFNSDAALVVTCSSDLTSRVWDARSGRPFTQPLRHPEQPRAAVFARDDRTLYTGGADKIVQRWALRGSAAALGEEVRGEHAEFSRDGRRVIAATAKGQPFVWDLATLQPLPTVATADVALARFNADGKRVVLVSGSQASIVQLDNGSGLSILHAQQISDVVFSPDGATFATASEDQTARVWNAATGEPITPPLWHGEPVASVRFSPDRRTLLTTTRGSGQTAEPWAARLWNAATGQPIGSPMPHEDNLCGAEFSPDGRLVATASEDNTARVWESGTGAPVSPALRHTRSVSAVAFSTDGRRVATASLDGTAHVWDAHTGTRLTRAMVHGDNLIDVQFSPDGRRVATASRDKTARLWDSATGQPLTESLRHSGPVIQVRFHPDGQRLLTSVEDRTARIWEVPDFSTPPPGWLAELAEIIALTEYRGESASPSSVLARFEKTRAAARATTGTGAYARLARSIFSEEGGHASLAAP